MVENKQNITNFKLLAVWKCSTFS